MIDRVSEIKARMTIPQVAAGFFPEWRPAKSCHSPFRSDRSPSFSVYDNGKAYKDFSTSEHGDVISFFQKATGTDFPKAVDALSRMAGIFDEKERPQKKEALRFPDDLRTGGDTELRQVEQLRNINLEACRIASDRGVLKFGTVCFQPCWIITNGTSNAQARRIDGKLFEAVGSLGERKAHTLRGSAQAAPIGLPTDKPFIALVEGSGDLLAANHFAHAENKADRLGVVAMLGASNRLTDTALKQLAGKRIRVFRHADEAGEKAARGWAGQLESVGCSVDIFDCGGVLLTGGGTSKDLNDLTGMDADYWEENRPLLDHLFDFVEG
jgi:hypothetical protein